MKKHFKRKPKIPESSPLECKKWDLFCKMKKHFKKKSESSFGKKVKRKELPSSLKKLAKKYNVRLTRLVNGKRYKKTVLALRKEIDRSKRKITPLECKKKKIRKVMREFKAGKLKSNGKVVKDRKQAIVIAIYMAKKYC